MMPGIQARAGVPLTFGARPRTLGLAAAAVLWLAACAPAVAQDDRMLAISRSTAIAIGPGRTAVPLVPPSAEPEPASVGARLGRLGPGARVYVQLEQASARGEPGVTYNVYLNLPATRPPAGASDPAYVGTFSFHGIEGRSRDIALDITPYLADLLASGALDDAVCVVIVPAGEPDPRAAPRVARIALIAR